VAETPKSRARYSKKIIEPDPLLHGAKQYGSSISEQIVVGSAECKHHELDKRIDMIDQGVKHRKVKEMKRLHCRVGMQQYMFAYSVDDYDFRHVGKYPDAGD